MTIKEKMELSLKESMKSGDVTRKNILRVVLTNLKLAEVEKGNPLDDIAVVSILQKEIKIHKDSIQEAEKANRQDLADQYKQEMKILEEYLPEQLDETEIRELVKSAIAEVGATSPADMGKVMKVIMPKTDGRAPNSEISRITRELLS
jgi:uncharacterized protein YqeY